MRTAQVETRRWWEVWTESSAHREHFTSLVALSPHLPRGICIDSGEGLDEREPSGRRARAREPAASMDQREEARPRPTASFTRLVLGRVSLRLSFGGGRGYDDQTNATTSLECNLSRSALLSRDGCSSRDPQRLSVIQVSFMVTWLTALGTGWGGTR